MAAFSEMASVANVDELLQEEANTNMNLRKLGPALNRRS